MSIISNSDLYLLRMKRYKELQRDSDNLKKKTINVLIKDSSDMVIDEIRNNEPEMLKQKSYRKD